MLISPTNGTIFTEYLQKASRGPGPERTKQNPTGGAGQKKERREQAGQDLYSLGRGRGAEGKEKVLHLGKPLHQQGDQQGQKRSLGAWSRVQQLVSGRQDRVRPPDGACHSSAHPSLKCGSVSVDGGWGLERGLENRPG